MLAGESEVTKANRRFTAKKNDLWTCNTGTVEGDADTSRRAATMLVVGFMA
jgi:hypothetical protein